MESEHYGYIYRIIIDNKESKRFNGCSYIGQHKYSGDSIDPKYYGSGVRLDYYKNKYGINGLIVKGIIWAYSSDQLNKFEKLFILIERIINPGKCLNLTDGGNDCSELIKYKSDKEKELLTERIKESVKSSWTEERRLKQSILTKRRYANNPEERIKTGELTRSLWKKDGHREKISSIIKKLIWWNNGIKNIRSIECPGDGYVKGRLSNMYSEEYKIKMSEKNKGLRWYNNGIKEIFVKENPGNGYILGRIKKK